MTCSFALTGLFKFSLVTNIEEFTHTLHQLDRLLKISFAPFIEVQLFNVETLNQASFELDDEFSISCTSNVRLKL